MSTLPSTLLRGARRPQDPAPGISRDQPSRADLLLPAALAVVVGAVYAATLLPGVGYHGDTAKFQFLGRALGTGHPPGEPVYTLVNALFVRALPGVSPALAANALSAVLGVAALVVLYHLLRHLGSPPLVAAAVAATQGFLPAFWGQAVVAEVYTLLALVTVSILLLVVRWYETGRDRYLMAGLVLSGVAVGVHTMVVLLAPGLLYIVLRRRPRALLEPRVLAAGLLGGLLGLGAYGYLLWRTADPATPYVEAAVTDLSSFLQVLTGQQFHGWMFAYSPTDLLTDRVPAFARLLAREYLVLVPVAAVGLFSLRRSTLSQGFSLMAATIVTFALNYAVPDLPVFFLLAYLVGMVWVARGAADLVGWAHGRLSVLAGGRAARLIPAAGLLLLPVGFAAFNYGFADHSDDVANARYAETVLAEAPEGALIFPGDYHMAQYLWYYLIGGRSPRSEDLRVASYSTSLETLTDYLEGESLHIPEQRVRVAPGRPVLVLRWVHARTLRRRGVTIEPVRAGPYTVYRARGTAGLDGISRRPPARQ